MTTTETRPETAEALRKIILALDFVLWQMTPGLTDQQPSEISKHRMALVEAGRQLGIWCHPGERPAVRLRCPPRRHAHIDQPLANVR